MPASASWPRSFNLPVVNNICKPFFNLELRVKDCFFLKLIVSEKTMKKGPVKALAEPLRVNYVAISLDSRAAESLMRVICLFLACQPIAA